MLKYFKVKQTGVIVSAVEGSILHKRILSESVNYIETNPEGIPLLLANQKKEIEFKDKIIEKLSVKIDEQKDEIDNLKKDIEELTSEIEKQEKEVGKNGRPKTRTNTNKSKSNRIKT